MCRRRGGGGGKPEPRGNGDSETPTGPWSPAALGAAWTPQRGAGSYPCLLKDSPSPLCLNFPDNRMEEKRPRPHPAPGKKGALLMWCFQTPRCPHTQALSSAQPGTSTQRLDARLPITARGCHLTSFDTSWRSQPHPIGPSEPRSQD